MSIAAKFHDSVSQYIAKHGLIPPGTPVVVALSGGADSIALLLVLHSLGYDIEAAHCNFGLRGEESDGDQQFVRDLCDHLGVRLHLLCPDVPARMRRYGESLEMACRELRYEWFETLRSQRGTPDREAVVAVAHHRDDDIETMLLNMLRGSGIDGLSGIKPRREPGIVRPLLGVTRSQIIAYLESLHQPWRTDSSNNHDDVLRNKVRLRVMPLLRTLFDNADTRLGRTLDNLKEQNHFHRIGVEALRRQYVDDDGAIDITLLKQEQPCAAMLLWEWLHADGLTRAMADDIIDNPDRSGVTFGPFTLSRGKLSKIGERLIDKPLPKLADGPWSMTIVGREEFHPTRDASVAWFDAHMLDGEPEFAIRAARRGDRVRTFGLRGRTRLLSDIYTDLQLDANTRRTTPLLTRNGVIIWVPGIVTTAEYQVTDDTICILRLEYKR